MASISFPPDRIAALAAAYRRARQQANPLVERDIDADRSRDAFGTPVISNGLVVAVRPAGGGPPVPTYGRGMRAPTIAEWYGNNVGQDIGDYFDDRPIGNNLSGGDGSYAGVTGPATFYNVNTGGNQGALNNAVANANGGQLSFDQQASFVNGSNLLEVEEYLPYIDPLLYIQFETEEIDGVTVYYNARLITSDQLANLERTARSMNFPTAVLHARNGVPIARLSWGGGEGNPTTWLTYEGGVWFYNTPTSRNVVTSDDSDEETAGSPNITQADLLSQDWITPQGCQLDPVAERPDFKTGNTEATTPKFDVYNPPCHVR